MGGGDEEASSVVIEEELMGNVHMIWSHNMIQDDGWLQRERGGAPPILWVDQGRCRTVIWFVVGYSTMRLVVMDFAIVQNCGDEDFARRRTKTDSLRVFFS